LFFPFVFQQRKQSVYIREVGKPLGKI